eukprot:scaffold7576_cov417-Prasinococcus_capsulatus_cf.AAC.9
MYDPHQLLAAQYVLTRALHPPAAQARARPRVLAREGGHLLAPADRNASQLDDDDAGAAIIVTGVLVAVTYRGRATYRTRAHRKQRGEEDAPDWPV